jgi:acyl carrier protein
MTRDDVMDLLIAELRKALPLDDHVVRDDDALRELPEIDSLRLVRIATALETQTGCEFTDEDLFALHTVGELADALLAALAVKP